MPGFPGTWIIGISLSIYCLATGFTQIQPLWFAVGLSILVAAEASEYAVGAAGARRFGARRPGVVGALLGSIAGVFLLGPIGVIAGPIIGAVTAELLWKRPPEEAIKAGVGATLGVIGGAIVKFIMVAIAVSVILMKLY